MIGYLWAAVDGHAASFVRRVDGPEAAFRAPLVWSKRLRAAATEGATPLGALRKWKGAPEDPEGGGITADAPEREAETLSELKELANPGWVDPLQDFLVETQVQAWPDGTPMDRSKGWGPLAPMQLPETDYPALTEAAVRYLPVTRGDVVLGYLWASVTDDAAYYVERASAGDDGINAGGVWVPRLREAANEGLTPLQALRKWKGAPEDPRGGTIKADAREQQAPSLEALKERARQ
ncbi:hypothetical protein ABZ801_00735 [Actinomadura sp. NPDC047616]|uniref:hypothetical protein n=1 Tax=Actinomadura sp. NPDC047616 TaxID=3155914 RepID=UPI0033E20588